MKVAVAAWLVTHPLKNPGAPPSAFAMKQYSLSTQQQSDHMNQLTLQKSNRQI
jgi:hypothetical protein